LGSWNICGTYTNIPSWKHCGKTFMGVTDIDYRPVHHPFPEAAPPRAVASVPAASASSTRHRVARARRWWRSRLGPPGDGDRGVKWMGDGRGDGRGM